jgi:hypothetical protein
MDAGRAGELTPLILGEHQWDHAEAICVHLRHQRHQRLLF